jgi:hypothetical protein
MHNETIREQLGIANTVEDIRNIPRECIRAIQYRPWGRINVGRPD